MLIVPFYINLGILLKARGASVDDLRIREEEFDFYRRPGTLKAPKISMMTMTTICVSAYLAWTRRGFADRKRPSAVDS